MTLISVAFGLCGAPFFLSAQPLWQTIGALLFLAHSMLDGCDGELARLKFEESRWGGVLDFWGDNVVHGVDLRLHRHRLELGERQRLAAAAGRCRRSRYAGFGGPCLLADHAAKDDGGPALHLGRQRARQPLRQVLDALSRRDFIYGVVVLALFGWVKYFLLLSARGADLFFRPASFSRSRNLAHAEPVRPLMSARARRRRRRSNVGRHRSGGRTAAPRPDCPRRRLSRRRENPDDAVEPVGMVRAFGKRRADRQRRSPALREHNTVPSTCKRPWLPSISIAFARSSAAQVRKMRARAEPTSRSTVAVSSSGHSWNLRVSRPAETRLGTARPAQHAIERVPAMIEQDAAAGHGRIDAPVLDALPPTVTAGWVRSVCQCDAMNGADRAGGDQRGHLAADRRFQPVMNGMQRPALARGRRASAGASSARVTSGFSQSTCRPASSARPIERRMAARRRADIDEVELLAGQQIVGRVYHWPSGQAARNASRRPGAASLAATISTSARASQPGSARWPRHCRSR